MEEPNRNAPTSSVGQIKKVVSKVIVITPKQIAEMGLENQIKNIKMGTVIGQIKEVESGDGTTASKPVKAAFLTSLRTKMNTLLNHSPLVMQVDPERTVDLVYKDVKKEACEAADVIQVLDEDNSENEEVEVPKPQVVQIHSNTSVQCSSSDLKILLDRASIESQKHKLQTVILNNNKLLQKKIVSHSSKTENLLCVADLTPAASQNTATSSGSERERTPEKETRDVPVKKDLIDLDALLAAKKVITDAAARNVRTVPRTFAQSAFRDQQVVRTYSKAQSISVVGGLKPRVSHKRVIHIHKKGSKPKSDEEDSASNTRPYKHRKSKETPAEGEKDLELSVEEKVRRIMDECKEKETTDQSTPIAPKKRGRPRKTPLQPKVDIEPAEKDKNDTLEKTDSLTPRKRGRPRKVNSEGIKDDKSPDANSPKKKQRRRKSEADEREYSAPSSISGGVRTSGRKRKVVDYAALSGGRISSSEEEDFAEIERLTGIKHETSEDESDEEIQKEEEEEDKEKAPSKAEAVHPLKKRLKMEHAQAAEKEKMEDANEEKKPDGKEEETDKHENNDIQNNTVKETELPQGDKKVEESTENSTKSTASKTENQNSTHKEEKTERTSDTISENNTQNTENPEKTPEGNEIPKSTPKEEVVKDQDNQVELSKTKQDEKSESEIDITCALCKETFKSESGWVKHKESQHNNLAWKVGEPPLDLENYDLVCKTLTVTLKKYGTLVCEVCGQDFSSAVKFIKHARKCKNVCFDYERKTDLGAQSAVKRRSGAPGTSVADVIKTIVPKISPARDRLSSLTKENGETVKKKGVYQKFSGDVKCAVCEEVMPNGRWILHKETKHNNLSWREGEEPLDLNDHKLVTKILSVLYKQKKPLRCENCGVRKKSVVGFMSHKQQCQKSDEELNKLRVTCVVCQRTMLPVSLPIHMQLYHSEKEPDKQEEETTTLTPRKAAKKAIDIIQQFNKQESDCDSSPKKLRKLIRDVDFTSCEEITKKFQEDINLNTYARCVYENCDYQTENIDDLMDHLSWCDKKIESSAFTCNYCLATYAQRKDALQHLEVHSNKTDDDYVLKEIQDDKSFIVKIEEEVEPLEYLDEEIDCQVGQGHPNLVRSHSKFVVSKAKFLQSITSNKSSWTLFSLAYSWTQEFVNNNFNAKNLFPCYTISANQFKVVPPEDITVYLPKLRRSIDVTRVHISTLQNPIAMNHTWKNYRLFEGDIYSDGTSTIFCGGPVNCLAWIPTPHTNLEEDQLLSVSVLPDSEAKYDMSKVARKSLIQIWNFGPLKNKSSSDITPKLEFCIAHKYGVIYNLEWCPSGCYDSLSEDTKVLKRLGLLAVANSDPFVYIYVVPQPNQINGKVLDCTPILKLSLSKDVDVEIGEVAYFSTKTSWTKSAGHKHIAAGYSNGVVALYSLEKLGENVRGQGVLILYPVQSFNAHFDAITALALSHLSAGNRYLLSGSLYKDLKLWDLEDTSDAIYVNRKYPVNDLTWNIHWLSPVVCYDNVTNMISSLVPLREHNGVSASFATFNSRVTSVTSNDWGNLYINCSDSGEAVAYIAHQLNEKFEGDKRRIQSRYLLSYTGFVSKNLTVDENQAIQKNKLKQLKNNKVLPENAIDFGPRNYEDAKNNYGLIFCDMFTMKGTLEPPNTEHKKLVGDSNYYSVYKPDLYPMQSITKTVLNQNMQSFHYYALGYQVGFVRVSKLGFLNK